MPVPRVPPAIAAFVPRPQEEFRQNKEKLIEQETKKRMLEEMWQDRVSIAPEEQREIEREQQQQKEAVKALKRQNQEQEALLHAKAKELETVRSRRSEVRRGLCCDRASSVPGRLPPEADGSATVRPPARLIAPVALAPCSRCPLRAWFGLGLGLSGHRRSRGLLPPATQRSFAREAWRQP